MGVLKDKPDMVPQRAVCDTGETKNADPHFGSVCPMHFANMILSPSPLPHEGRLFVPILQMSKLILRKPGHNLQHHQTRTGQGVGQHLHKCSPIQAAVKKDEGAFSARRHAMISNHNPPSREGSQVPQGVCKACKREGRLCCSNMHKRAPENVLRK